jgi:hypothetical protein
MNGIVWRCALSGCGRLLAATVLVLILQHSAFSEDQITVQSGSTAVIATSDKPLKNTSGQVKGSLIVGESAGSPKPYSLLYVAPKTSSGFVETVRYSNGTDHAVQVSVTSASESAIYSQSFKALFALFVLATILESGLAVIFNWRPFVQLFDARGMKTIVSVAFALFFVTLFDFDILTRLVDLYSDAKQTSSVPCRFITALVLAGGSAGVNNLLVALGFRSVKTAEQTTPKPAATEAWVAIRLIRDKAVGPVFVLIGTQGVTPAVAGTISGSSRDSSILRYFVRDYGRFPASGGHSVAPLQSYLIRLEGTDKSGTRLTTTWGPYALAPGAIVDIALRV